MLLFYRKILFILILHFEANQFVISQSFDIYKTDTINRIDASNKKQGRWIFFYTNGKQLEKEGLFENDNKTGVWKSYYQNGKIKSEITYKNNQPNGPAKMYYENGKISEEGFWKGTIWVGAYNYYHKNGQKAYEWNFDESGQRNGVQKYYYENGKLYIKGEWIAGKENGTITEYNEDGSLKAEKHFNGGHMDPVASKFYQEQKIVSNEVPKDSSVIISKNRTENTTSENTSQSFNGNGFHKLYNISKKIDREGEFRNGQLINGKRYYYDTDGKLVKTVIYENGTINKTIKEN